MEFFATNDAHRIGCVHRLINTAVGSWGVEELEVAIKPAPWRRRKAGLVLLLPPARRWRRHAAAAADEAHAEELPPPPPPASTMPVALTILVLEDLPRSTQGFVYARLFSSRASRT